MEAPFGMNFERSRSIAKQQQLTFKVAVGSDKSLWIFSDEPETSCECRKLIAIYFSDPLERLPMSSYWY